MNYKIQEETLKQFKEELYAEGILHDGDTFGTNETLLYVNNPVRLNLPEELIISYQAVSTSAQIRLDPSQENVYSLPAMAQDSGRSWYRRII